MTDTPDPRTYPRKSARSFSARMYRPLKGKQMIRAPHSHTIRADYPRKSAQNTAPSRGVPTQARRRAGRLSAP